MHDQMQDGMAEATRLTREGRLPKRPPLFSVPSGALSPQGRQRTGSTRPLARPPYARGMIDLALKRHH